MPGEEFGPFSVIYEYFSEKRYPHGRANIIHYTDCRKKKIQIMSEAAGGVGAVFFINRRERLPGIYLHTLKTPKYFFYQVADSSLLYAQAGAGIHHRVYE